MLSAVEDVFEEVKETKEKAERQNEVRLLMYFSIRGARRQNGLQGAFISRMILHRKHFRKLLVPPYHITAATLGKLFAHW